MTLYKKKKKDWYLIIPTLFALFVLYIIFLPKEYFEGDFGFWTNWCSQMMDFGLTSVYESGCNYHPIFLYFLYGFGKICGSNEMLFEQINYIKIIPLIFDFIGVLAFLYFFKNQKKSIFLPLFLILNLSYLYNTMFWGQVDSIYTTLSLLSIIFALLGNINLAVVFIVFAFNSKLQAIIFLPIFGLVLLPDVIKNPKKIVYLFAFGFVTQLMILMPFILKGKVGQVISVFTGGVDHYTNVSLFANNIWYLFLWNKECYFVEDSTTFMGFSYKNIGLVLFLCSSFLSLLPLFLRTIKLLKGQSDEKKEQYIELVFFSCLLTIWNFFYFNTQMHERYSHALIIFCFFYGFLSKNWFLYIIATLGLLLNMTRVFPFAEYDVTKYFFYNQHFISIVFGLGLLYGYYLLFSKYYIKNGFRN